MVPPFLSASNVLPGWLVLPFRPRARNTNEISDLKGPQLYFWLACTLGLPVSGYRASSVLLGPEYFEFMPKGNEDAMRAPVNAVYGSNVSDEPSNEMFCNCDNDANAYWTCVDVVSCNVAKRQITKPAERFPIGAYCGADLFSK